MPIETTEKYVRARVRLSGEFQAGSLRTITLSAAQGIKQIVGRLKGKDTTTAQSYLFDKAKWDVKKVRAWMKEHNLTIKQETLDEEGELSSLLVAPDDNILYGFDDMNVKEEEDAEKKKHLYIEGFFSTTDKDRHGDIITKEFYEYNIKKGYIKQAMTVLLDHNPEKVVGKVVKYELRKRTTKQWGLWVRVQISNADDVKDVRTKIKEGSLNAFSFRWKGVANGEEPIDPDKPWGSRRVKAGVIIESSVVSLPANPKASVERWYEKSLPMPSAEVIAEAEARGDDDVTRKIAEELADELLKALRTKSVEKPALENAESKQEVSTKDSKGEKEPIMNEEAIKKLIAKMTPDMWAALDDDVKTACKEIDSGIEARLENAKLKAENEALKKKAADDKAAKEKAAKEAAAKGGETPPAETPPVETPPAGDADDDTPVTAKSVKELIAEGIRDGLKNALGTTERQTGTGAGSGGTTDMGVGEDAKLQKMLSGASKEGKELTADEVADRLLGAYFVPGTDKRYRQGVTAIVNKIANGEALE